MSAKYSSEFLADYEMKLHTQIGEAGSKFRKLETEWEVLAGAGKGKRVKQQYAIVKSVKYYDSEIEKQQGILDRRIWEAEEEYKAKLAELALKHKLKIQSIQQQNQSYVKHLTDEKERKVGELRETISLLSAPQLRVRAKAAVALKEWSALVETFKKTFPTSRMSFPETPDWLIETGETPELSDSEDAVPKPKKACPTKATPPPPPPKVQCPHELEADESDYDWRAIKDDDADFQRFLARSRDAYMSEKEAIVKTKVRVASMRELLKQ